MADAPRPEPALAFAVDCDRTLTGDNLVPDPDALQALADLRAAGVRCVLVTGRSKEDLQRFAGIAGAFDAYVLEGGAVWGSWEDPTRPSNAQVALDAADRAARDGIHVERRTASFSAALADRAAVERVAAGCSIQPNVDRIDVLPPGLDKGMGLDAALAGIGCRAARVVAIGDGENDLPMFARAHVALAVANAVPATKEAADEVLASPGPAAVVEAARRLLLGDWRDDPATLPAAA
jgi:hydroxymethylpyrimidine pyrophosphatase-like HAD family hydrolase